MGVRVAALALVVLVAALVHGWPRLIPVAVLGVGAVYAVQLAIDGALLDPAVPLVAGGLYVTAELAFWSLEERSGVKAGPGESLRGVAVLVARGLGALVVAAVLLVLVDAVQARGLAVDLAGAAGAVGVLLAVVLIARGRGRTSH